MLTGLRVQNFKSWRDSGNIRLAPITVVFGPNSSGKTSLIQFLLMLRQTVESTDRRRVLDLGDASSLVELGTFHDIAYGHRPDTTLSFRLQWISEEPMWLENILLRPHDELDFHSAVSQRPDESLAVRHFNYFTAGEHFSVEAEDDGTYTSAHTFSYEDSTSEPPTKFFGFPEAPARPERESEIFSLLAFELGDAFRRLFHVGPLREKPRRSYRWAGAKPVDVGNMGERSVEALLAEKMSAGTPRPNAPVSDTRLLERVGRWLREMGVIHSFELRELVPGRRIFEAVVKTRPDSPEVLLTDVGFGVSQVLPVLVQSYYAEHGSTVIFEQPEIHLHPSVQSHLADVFIDAAKTRGVQFLIESHSEHLLRRLQRRLAEGAVSADDVALYFVEYGDDGSRLEPLDLDPAGKIKNWPRNFFGDDFTDIAVVAKISAQQRMEEARRERENNG